MFALIAYIMFTVICEEKRYGMSVKRKKFYGYVKASLIITFTLVDGIILYAIMEVIKAFLCCLN
jgi:uncharacterized membrane protein SirB2